MKKMFLVILFLGGLTLLCSYFFIPAKINFAKVIYIKTKVNSANRYISDDSKWSKWWPANDTNNLSDSLNKVKNYYKNYYYIINRKMFEGMDILIEHDSIKAKSFLHIISISTDSVALEWIGELPYTYNPFKKIKNYLLASGIKKNITEILQSAKIFLENNEQVYGIKIIQQKVNDTLLISTKSYSTSYPSTQTIYELINNLKKYISLNNGTETNYPMLNITGDNQSFRTMVAIPINKTIPENEKFFIKKMVPGKILVSEVKGGIYTTIGAIKQIETYMEDNHLQSPAMPFESLVTARDKESDTAKWLTKIFYPVF